MARQAYLDFAEESAAQGGAGDMSFTDDETEADKEVAASTATGSGWGEDFLADSTKGTTDGTPPSPHSLTGLGTVLRGAMSPPPSTSRTAGLQLPPYTGPQTRSTSNRQS
jgi:hypothetical protein